MSITWIIFFAIIVAFAGVCLSYVYYELKTGVPTFPTMPAMQEKIIALLRADMAARPHIRPYTIIDLGSGSGQMTQRIARALPEARIIGIEISFVPWLRSYVRQKFFGPTNVVYKRLDFWPYDSSEADAVITYLLASIIDRVGTKLRRELKPGTLILANTFPLGDGWQPVETFSIDAPFFASLSGKTNLYQYRQTATPAA